MMVSGVLRGSVARALILGLMPACAAPAAGGEALKPGEVVERVACQDAPDQSYALYLPPSYTAQRQWPILYVLDPRERGRLGVEVFRSAAERLGWIVVGSYNTLSDAPDAHERNIAAMGAMWRDTHGRLAIDPQRVYAAGMSGGARASAFLADAAPGTIAGVIACAAGFSPARAPHAGLSFAVFGSVGSTDFNYLEMQDLDRTLSELGVPHRIATFDGGHSWPPELVASAAVEWLELRAMRQGRRDRDAALIERLYASATERAQAYEAAGWVIEAAAAWRDVAESFGELRGVAPAEAAWRRIESSKLYRRTAESRAKLLRRERAAKTQAARIFASIDSKDAGRSLGRLLRELEVERLRKDASSSDVEKGLSAQRRLAALYSQLSFYVPEELKTREDYPRALLAVRAAAQIRPESPRPWLARATIQARAGEPNAALESLRRAVELLHAAIAPFPKADRVETLEAWRVLIGENDELAALHARSEFGALLERLTPPDSGA